MTGRILSIEYIRGIAMLGVIGIHTGAYSLSNPDVNIHLFALLEIASRFSVPIFFFVSAFGLFASYRPDAPFSYRSFMAKRIRTVLIPYLVWSFIYLALFTWRSEEPIQWDLPLIGEYLFFGWGQYQLYFLVLLFWFYLFMPLWRRLLPLFTAHPFRSLSVLLVLQIGFNYYSSYGVMPAMEGDFLRKLVDYRMSYLILHYVFVFMLGAICAVRYDAFIAWLTRYRRPVAGAFWASLGAMLLAYYTLLLFYDYPPVSGVNTVHQLSPIGVIYTLTACLYLVSVLSRPLPPRLAAAFALLARHSYPIYLVHPFFMYYLEQWLTGSVATVPIVLLFYTATVLLSLLFGVLLEKTSAALPLLSTCLIGSLAPKTKTKT